jgi:hypothetical protein
VNYDNAMVRAIKNKGLGQESLLEQAIPGDTIESPPMTVALPHSIYPLSGRM